VSTTKDRASTAPDIGQPLTKSIELEQRLSRLELQQREILDALDELMKKATATQAHLDHLSAKISRVP
jgi:uncharacterized coiled-coil protein SlyX